MTGLWLAVVSGFIWVGILTVAWQVWRRTARLQAFSGKRVTNLDAPGGD